MRNLLRLCGTALALVLAGTATAQNSAVSACFALNTNGEQKDCLAKLYRSVSAELNDVYRRALESAAKFDEQPRRPGDVDTRSHAAAIAKSQQAWEAYREAECWGVLSLGGGSGRMGWVFACMAEKTMERIRELKVPYEQR